MKNGSASFNYNMVHRAAEQISKLITKETLLSSLEKREIMVFNYIRAMNVANDMASLARCSCHKDDADECQQGDSEGKKKLKRFFASLNLIVFSFSLSLEKRNHINSNEVTSWNTNFSRSRCLTGASVSTIFILQDDTRAKQSVCIV